MTIGIHLAPGDLRRVTAEPDAAETFASTRSVLFEELGIVIPPMRLTPDPDLRPGTIRFTWRGLASDPRIVPTAGEFSVFWWAGSIAEAEASEGLRAAQTDVLRSPGAPCVVLPDRFRDEVKGHGYLTYGTLDHLAFDISDKIREWAWQLHTEDATVELMNSLALEVPTLAAHARALPDGIVHRLLVDLLRDRVPIRNLARIVELALRYEAMESPAPDLLTFVRWGLSDVIGSLAARQTDVVVAYLVSQEHQDEPGPALLHDLEVELRELPRQASTPALLVSDAARPVVADLLRAAHPEVRVLGYGDLPPHLNVQPVARIGG